MKELLIDENFTSSSIVIRERCWSTIIDLTMNDQFDSHVENRIFFCSFSDRRNHLSMNLSFTLRRRERLWHLIIDNRFPQVKFDVQFESDLRSFRQLSSGQSMKRWSAEKSLRFQNRSSFPNVDLELFNYSIKLFFQSVSQFFSKISVFIEERRLKRNLTIFDRNLQDL